MNIRIAQRFACHGMKKDDTKRKVLLKITVENKKSQFYISLNRADYTLYLDEEEILLQAGLSAKVTQVSKSHDGEWTIFNLYISDKMVTQEKTRRKWLFSLPIILFCVLKLYESILYMLLPY